MPACLRQHSADGLLLQAVERVLIVSGFVLAQHSLRRQVVWLDLRTACEHDRFVQSISQFPYIAWPGIILQNGESFVIQCRGRFAKNHIASGAMSSSRSRNAGKCKRNESRR